MIILIVSIVLVCTIFGFKSILEDQAKVAKSRAIKVAKALAEDDSDGLDAIIDNMALNVVKLVKLNPYNREKLNSSLKAAEIKMSPEMFKSKSFVKAGLVMSLIIPAIIIFPISSIAVVAIAITTYFKGEKDLYKKVAEKREKIEAELPRFASTISQELGSSNDVLGILERYAKTAGDAFKKELNITIADMRSSAYEAALVRLMSRITSSSLSEIVRGLTGTIRGDDNRSYFIMLAHDLDELELQQLENLAKRQPEKIRKYSIMIFICFIVMYVVVLGYFTYLTTVKGVPAV